MPFDERETTAPDGFIPMCAPHIAGREWEYVKECLDTGWVSSVGSYVERFERDLAAAVGAPYAVATASGTAALHVALLLAGISPETEVVLPSLTFIAPANAVRYVGAWPVFVDVDESYWQLDPEELRRFLRQDCTARNGKVVNRHTGRTVTAVLAVDILGHPCDLGAIHDIAHEYGLAVVEDATESLGATYRERPLGQWSDLTCFSFNGNKLITTGGGGMLVTRREDLARRGRYLTTQAKDNPIEFIHGTVGFNYRLTNVQAAIGCAQLECLTAFLAAKRRIAARYSEAFGALEVIRCMGEADWARSAFWLSTILVEPRSGSPDSRQLLRLLEAARIQARPLWQPMHRSPAHSGCFARPCSVADRLHAVALCLPSSTSLSEADQEHVVTTVAHALMARGSSAQV